MTKVVACIIARTVSTRLPLKILRRIDPLGNSMIDFLIARLKKAKRIDEIFICTSFENVDDILEDVAERNNVKIYRGSPDQVIERLIAVGNIARADIILRITGDNPFTAYEYIDRQINLLIEKDLDYVRLIDAPLGATAEVIKFKALIKCSTMMDPDVSEYLMLFMFEPSHFKCGVIKPCSADLSAYSVTVDVPDDLVRSRRLIERYAGPGVEISLLDIVRIYDEEQIPFATIKPSSSIKLPYGKEISYEAFKADMQRRISSSTLVKLYE